MSNFVLRKRSVEHACLARLELADAAGVRESRRPHFAPGLVSVGAARMYTTLPCVRCSYVGPLDAVTMEIVVVSLIDIYLVYYLLQMILHNWSAGAVS